MGPTYGCVFNHFCQLCDLNRVYLHTNCTQNGVPIRWHISTQVTTYVLPRQYLQRNKKKHTNLCCWYNSVIDVIIYGGLDMGYILQERIEINPEVMLGKPVIRGTRITVELILRKLSEGATAVDLLDAYPRLTKEDIQAALAYAANTLANETILLQTAQ
jgi:uncharacterized protein (DUF433 family)